jgi:hypothetical protein
MEKESFDDSAGASGETGEAGEVPDKRIGYAASLATSSEVEEVSDERQARRALPLPLQGALAEMRREAQRA